MALRQRYNARMISSQYISRITLQREKVESFDVYPFALPAVRSLDTLELHPKVTFFVGENGSGKSTLLEAIAVSMGFNAEGGTKNFRFDTRSSHSTLDEYLRVAKGFKKPKDGFSCVPKVFSMSRQRSKISMPKAALDRRSSALMAASRCTNARTAKRFSRC
jgi:predicted ATPase